MPSAVPEHPPFVTGGGDACRKPQAACFGKLIVSETRRERERREERRASMAEWAAAEPDQPDERERASDTIRHFQDLKVKACVSFCRVSSRSQKRKLAKQKDWC